MGDKWYTAREVREAIDTSWHDLDREMVHDMLCQAADMVERCEAELALTDKSHYTYSRLNYILRGDAGKEEK